MACDRGNGVHFITISHYPVNIFQLYLRDIKLNKWIIQFFNYHFFKILYNVPIRLFYYNLKTFFKTDFFVVALIDGKF